MKSTHIYTNGNIHTLDSRASVVSSMAICNDRILAVGSYTETSLWKDSTTTIIDLGGKCVMPGFYDAHSHYMRAGMYSMFYVDVRAYPVGECRCLDDMVVRIQQRIADVGPDLWILCAGYDDTALAEARHFTLEEMDAIAPKNPLFIRHCSGHMALCNSLALTKAGITATSRNPKGGHYRRDVDGKLTGLLEEPAAMEQILKAAPAMSPERWMTSIEKAGQDYLAKGVTTAHEGGVTTDIWNNYMLAHEKGLLRNRVQLLPRHDVFDFGLAPNSRCGTQLTADNMLSLGAVKLFHDGSIQNYTGYLTNPYHRILGLPHSDLWRGYPICPSYELAEVVIQRHREGWQIAIHGNGDAAIDDILDAFEQAQKAYPRSDMRHIIIHCQTVREDQLDRMVRLGVMPSFFVVHTYFWGDRHRDIFLGEQRASRISPLRSALERNMTFTTHNDTAVTPIDPLLSVWSAVNRHTSSGKTLGKAQQVGVLPALRSITTWAAWQFHEEQLKGSLEPGKLADMVVLGADPTLVDPMEIRHIPILATIVGGQVWYGTM